uniref:PH domain-containing protein n=1 Tax=Coccolithus braarudii TaxID=221442 RepID=A0A7S0Q263_9EUKA
MHDVRTSPALGKSLLGVLKQGGAFYKHDFGRSHRSRKWMALSTDSQSLRWRSSGDSPPQTDLDVAVPMLLGSPLDRMLQRNFDEAQLQGNSPTPRTKHNYMEAAQLQGGSSSPRMMRLRRPASFSRISTLALKDIVDIEYGMGSETFLQKSTTDRVDEVHMCFSLRTVSGRTFDFAATDEDLLMVWLLGLQHALHLQSFTAATLRLKRLRFKIASTAERTGLSTHGVLLAAVRSAAKQQDVRFDKLKKLKKLQAAWRGGTVRRRFNHAASDLREIRLKIHALKERECYMKRAQEQTARSIQSAIPAEEAPAPPCHQKMGDPMEVERFATAMTIFATRQKRTLEEMSDHVRENREATAAIARIAAERRELLQAFMNSIINNVFSLTGTHAPLTPIKTCTKCNATDLVASSAWTQVV